MSNLNARVNLRISQEVHDSYARVAQRLNTTVTEMIREMVNDGVEVMDAMDTIMVAAEGGDKDAAADLLRLFMSSNEGRLQFAKAIVNQDLNSLGLEATDTQPTTKESGQDK